MGVALAGQGERIEHWILLIDCGERNEPNKCIGEGLKMHCAVEWTGLIAITEDYRSCKEPRVGKGARYDLYATAASSRSRRCRKMTRFGVHTIKSRRREEGFPAATL